MEGKNEMLFLKVMVILLPIFAFLFIAIYFPILKEIQLLMMITLTPFIVIYITIVINIIILKKNKRINMKIKQSLNKKGVKHKDG
jgi:hypothetical protein